jgi:hypothetical protein
MVRAMDFLLEDIIQRNFSKPDQEAPGLKILCCADAIIKMAGILRLWRF